METSDFLKQRIFLTSFNSVSEKNMHGPYCMHVQAGQDWFKRTLGAVLLYMGICCPDKVIFVCDNLLHQDFLMRVLIYSFGRCALAFA